MFHAGGNPVLAKTLLVDGNHLTLEYIELWLITKGNMIPQLFWLTISLLYAPICLYGSLFYA
ncbi:MAG: hypothetical protein EBR30_25555 [Cytophagia bacterium]|nr:hypothetical protein [Cytophagia bacterium]